MIRRQGENTGGRRRRAPSVRPFVMGAIALLLALQGLVAIGTSFAHSARLGGEKSFVVSVLGVTCVVNAHPGDDNAPLHEHRSAQCCILCGARDLDDSMLSAAAQTSETIAPSPVFVAIEGRSVETRAEFPTGWVSSWSSQAPPFFS